MQQALTLAATALLVVVLAVVPAGCGEEVTAAGDAAPGCAGCHQGKRSLAGGDAAELAGKIRRIRDGEIRHPPLGLDDDSDAAIDELAAELAGT